jgi:hypothetical protein
MKLDEETDTYTVIHDHREALETDEAYFTRDPGKLKVECVCPKCQQKHSVIFHWIGRGTPRKFCNRCRDRAESVLINA